MKEMFEEVKVEVIRFEQNVDVITDSGDVTLPPIPIIITSPNP